MPLVDVECKSCGQVSETLVRQMSEASCPQCGSHDIERKIGVPAIGRGGALPIQGSSCPPSNLPPCGPGCCRI